MSVITYKCPNCDGGLVFDPESGRYVCEYCRSAFLEQELETPQEETASAKQTSEQAVLYHCPSCGAEVITDETTAATVCFYCHNPIVLSGKLTGDYLPDGVIPFRITKEEAIERFHQWIGKKKFIPKGFYSKRQIAKLCGVYFPYWLYGCEVESSFQGTAKDLRVWRVGDTEYTETKTYEIRRAGKIFFRHLPKTALQKAETAMLKGIFPYQFDALEKFHMGYLSGFQAEKRDIEKDTLTEAVQGDIREYAGKRMRDTVTGHNSVSADSQKHTIKEEKFQYVLLPVWVLTYRERGSQVYYYAMNGQTGEIVGKLPVDFGKLSILCAAIFLSVFTILMIGGFLL